MKLDHEMEWFTEHYNRELMEAIEVLSEELGVQINHLGIEAFPVVESIQDYTKYLDGYGKYMIEYQGNPKASSREQIHKSVQNYIESTIFSKKTPLEFQDAPKTIQGYIESCQALQQKVDEIKQAMMEAGVSMDAVGDVNEFTDWFMDAFHEKFQPVMEELSKASGYWARNRKRPAKTSVFL